MRHPTHFIEEFFYWLGAKIGRHPKRVIASVLAITALLSLGLVNFRETNNVRTEYSPLRAPSQMEYYVAKNFLKQNGTLDPCYIMTSARDGGSLLRDEYRWLIYNMTRAIQTEVVVFKEIKNSVFQRPSNSNRFKPSNQTHFDAIIAKELTKSGGEKKRAFTFADLCEPYCDLNTAFLAFLKLYDPENPATFTYPSIYIFNTRAFIGNNVYGIELKNGSNELKSFTTAVMPFYLVADYEDTDVMIQWQHAAIRLFERPEYSRLLKTGMTGDNLVSYEVRRMGIETAPLILGSIVAMIIFVVTTSFRVNAIESKPWEAFIGCLVPLLAMVAALGLMSFFGLKFQSIVVAAIFLVLSVGVDDIFILTRAWHRSQPTSFSDERMALTLEDAGPSITISALTNVMSFAIGAISDTPAVRTFCIFSAVAITICFLYQLILLSAIIVYCSERRERRGYQSVLCCFKADPQYRNSFVKTGERLHTAVVRWWARVVTRWSTRIVLAITMAVYFAISYKGICQLQSNISIDKMALPDSYLHDFQESFETALRNMQPISVFVMNPGDLRQPQQLNKVKSLVYDFEHSLNAYGSDSTFFWLSQYEEFLRFYGGFSDDVEIEPEEEGQETTSKISPPSFTYTEIPAFFKSATYYYLSSFVHMNESACQANQPECISAFFFITNFHDVIKYHELVPTVKDWRRLAQNYDSLEVYAYSDHTPFVDQTMSIDQTVFGSVAAALICTAAICFVFIPHFMSVVAAVFSVLSISLGIFGLLSLWDVDLDPLSMAALLMAIGFSVDFTAHISYHYYKAPKASAQRRMQIALGIIGWPMMQVGLSTIVALMPLLFKRSYLAMVFLKTIVVVVLLGMFHGLVILPAVLTLFDPHSNQKCSNETKMKRKKSSIYGSGSVSANSSSSSGFSSSGGIISHGGQRTNSGGNGDSESDRSSQHSNERKESFYKTQHLIKSFRANEFGWLNQNRGFFGHQLKDANGKPVACNRSHSHSRRQTQGKVSPLSIADLTKITPSINPTVDRGPNTAFVHKIALGRSASNALLNDVGPEAHPQLAAKQLADRQLTAKQLAENLIFIQLTAKQLADEQLADKHLADKKTTTHRQTTRRRTTRRRVNQLGNFTF